MKELNEKELNKIAGGEGSNRVPNAEEAKIIENYKNEIRKLGDMIESERRKRFPSTEIGEYRRRLNEAKDKLIQFLRDNGIDSSYGI